MTRTSIPTWSELFGSLDTKEADAGREITSPAAYLADLLQLLDERFNSSDFRNRRPDIPGNILLNGDQSFTLTRQLDITNSLLGAKIEHQQATPADAVLAKAQHPFLLPFEYQHERVRQALSLLRTSYRDLHTSFAPQVDIDALARERLSLSPARAATVVTDLSKDPANLRNAYGLAANETLAGLADLDGFQSATQLDAATLRQLLFSQLSQIANNAVGAAEIDAAPGELFINRDLGGFAKLDTNEQRLIWSEKGKAVPDAWFDRVHRLLCLSRWTNIDLTALDLFLRQLCGNTLDANALRRLAVIVDLRDRTKAPMDELCAVFGEIDGEAALGAGDDPDNPASLFDRVFNGDAATLATQYLRSGCGYLPQLYMDWRELAATGDVLSDNGDNQQLRARIQTALSISATDLAAVIQRFRDRATARGRVSLLGSRDGSRPTDSHSLSVLYRHARLADYTGLALLDLLQLVEVMEKDPYLKVLNAFDVLDPEENNQADLYQVLEEGPPEARFWLLQNLIAIAAWAGAAGLEPDDLASITAVPTEAALAEAAAQAQQDAAELNPAATETATPAQISIPTPTADSVAFAQSLYDAFLPTALTADKLQSGGISDRMARIALATFQQPAQGLVSTADARLATWDKHKARDAAHSALAGLDVVSGDDIGTLQLGEDLSKYLQSVLIRRGVLDANGMLLEDQFPLTPDGIVLEPEGSAQFGQIFDFLSSEYAVAVAQLTPAQDQTDDGSDQTADDSDGTDQETADDTVQAEGAAPGQQTVDDAVQPDADTADQETADDTSQDQADSQDQSTSDDTSADDTSQDDGASAADQAPDTADIEIQLFNSDLLSLGFTLADADEWIARLTFLQVLDSSGSVLAPSLFSDPANRDNIKISVGFDTFRTQIYTWLAGRRDAWLNAELTLPDDIWDSLSLTDAEKQDLQQNLIFNGYIDTARKIADRTALAALTSERFELAPEFRRQRRPILDALQAVVTSARENLLTVTPDNLRPLADQFAASDVLQTVSAACLDSQMCLTPSVIAEIANEQPPFELDPPYSAAQAQSVWNLLQDINSEAGTFQLTDTALASIGITGDHTTNMVAWLCANGCLQPDRSLSAKQVKRFASASAAQKFIIPQYADYSLDVFNLIHTVAVATDAAVQALTTALQAAGTAQDQAVLGAVGSQVGLSSDATSAILKPLLRGGAGVTVAIMAPVLRAAIADVVQEPPSDRTFRAAIGRTQAFANFANKLRMTPQQIEAAFRDQQLVQKFPEGIELPQGCDGIDALWAGPGGQASGSWIFSAGDIVNLTSFSSKLGQPARPIDTWLAGRLTAASTAAIATFRSQGSDPASVKTVLLQDINRLLTGSTIYDSERFSGVALRPKAQELLSLSLMGGVFPGLNRLLLEDAYPAELARNELYLFRGPRYWTFDANTLELDAGPLPLETLSADFKGLGAVDAVYTLSAGDHWLLAEGKVWRRASDSERWVQLTGLTARTWGSIKSSFDDPANIDGTLLDSEGRIYLFCGDQYIRYANWPQDFVDEGYPRRIATHWPKEIGFGPLPDGWDEGIDAGVARGDEVTWLFKGDSFVASTEPGVERKITDFWGCVRNNLGSASRVDAVLDIAGRCGIAVGDQVSVFSNSLESEGVTTDEGYPRKLDAVFPDLPENFADGIDAGLTDQDGTVYLFRDLTCATRDKNLKWTTVRIGKRWGLIDNTLRQTGRVDAALTGLDGKVYLFSGAQYVRYSGSDLSRVDEGYPRTIARDWGGLPGVEAAFVLDGKTYVFGSDHVNYLRFSTRDYSKPDPGYPKPIDDNWWNLPAALLTLEFHRPDAVLVAPNGHIHLFRGDQTIHSDHNHRWWSEPAPIHDAWKSLPFSTVSAGFTGRDGRTYIFSSDGEPSFVRYSDPSFERVDDRFPKPVKEHWGKVVNNIERSGRVDAAVTVVSQATGANGQPGAGSVRYRYLFSGDQFYRYSSEGQRFVDEGYPLRIRGNLRREPQFAHLDAPADQGIDGVWADTGNVFVFIAGQIYVASVDYSRELQGFAAEDLRAADVEEGRLTVCGKAGWQHILPPEAPVRADQPVMPRALRTVPPQFQQNLSAILRGLDNNVYLFRDGLCYDKSLERQYPTGGAFGQVHNSIAEDEHVDSALMGRDGKLYLFRGDQFVSYTPKTDTPTVLPDLADAIPSPIAATWGGLGNVRHCFVLNGVTYLLEAPADDGSFRYIRYSGTDYTKPSDPAPQEGDFSFWKIPASSVSRGFDGVDAVLADADGLILIRDTRFLHYDATADAWSAPRPLSLRWPGIERHYPDFETISAVFSGPDGLTYFFGDRSWVSHDGNTAAPPFAISQRWALLANRIMQQNRVDAVLVHGDQTYLFSGDQYARYTGTDYEYVDAGYPRPIAVNLRTETPFLQLPEEIEGNFESLQPDDVWVAAAFSTGGVVVVNVAKRTFALSAQVSRSYPIAQVAQVRNELVRLAKVDAAFSRDDDGALFLLSGDQYVRYSKPELDEVDDGYPRAIGDSLLGELQGQPTRLPPVFQENLDGALYLNNHILVLFKDKQFVQHDPDAKVDELAPVNIKGTWGQVSNPFLPSKTDPLPRMDAAFVAPDQSLYVFKGGLYLHYTDPTAVYVDEGYPRAIRDQWGDLPDDFKAAIDGAFVLDGRTYLCRDKQYVRYGDPGYRRMDPIYPQLFSNRWRASNDFLLGDLRTIQRYVALDQSHPSDSGSLTDFLLGPPDQAEPYGLLVELFDWNIADVQWLKRRDAFLDRPGSDQAEETDFDIAQVLRIYSTLELTGRLGSHPQEVYEQVWTPLYGAPSNPATAADTLERLLGTLYPGDAWKKIQRQLGDALSVALRDAQVAWLLAHSPEQFTDARDLSDFLLTDVEVDSVLDTSPIVEAISAIQLYFYRYLTNLEPAAEPPAQPGDSPDAQAARRAEFKTEWSWMQNYRVWQANREVFLYPETYIRPELRSTRTEAFKTLQQNLQQGDITNDSVTQAYKQYLDAYTEVSRLIIAGGYVWQPDPAEPDATELTLFGATRTQPRNYYYRLATFTGGNASTAAWDAWQPLGITINSDLVYPVRAFGRTFVFWAETVQIQQDDQSSATLTTTTKDNTQTVSNNQNVQYQDNIMYSFCDLSGQWTAPQTLGQGLPKSQKTQTTHLRVSGAETDGADSVESIVVDYSYDLASLLDLPLVAAVGNPVAQVIEQALIPLQVYTAKQLTADLTVTDVAPYPIVDAREDTLKSLFNFVEYSSFDDLSRVIQIGSAGRNGAAPWYSFDMKGGSFLAQPAEANEQAGSNAPLVPLNGNQQGLPDWNNVDACLDGSDGHQYLFNNQNMVYAVRKDPAEHPIDSRWGLRFNQVHADGQVDAAWNRGDVYFLSRGDRYLMYSHGLDWADDAGERSTGNNGKEDGVPGGSIDAAFTDKANTTWFFQGSKYVSVDSNKTFSNAADIKDRWGLERNAFTSPKQGDAAVVGAFSRDGRSFLIGPDSYTTYSDPAVTLCTPPQPQSLRAILEQLQCTNSGDVDAGVVIVGALDDGTELLFKARTGAGSQIYSFADKKVAVAKPEPTPGPWQDIASFMYGGSRFALTPIQGGAAVTVSGSSEQRVYSRDIRAALVSPDGHLYLFSVDSYLLVNPAEISIAGIGNAIDQWASRSASISSRWGRVGNVFTSGGPVTAALVRDGQTFLVSGDQYVRYSGSEYQFVDEGYPKPLANNPDRLPAVAFKAGLEMPAPDRRTCYFIGTHYAFDNDLSTQILNQDRWGRIRTNILVRGVDTAYRIGNRHYLFSGDEISCYTAGAGGSLAAYMDPGNMDRPPVVAELGSFGTVRAAFAYKGLLYLVGRDSFICCQTSQPEQLLPEYPREGSAPELVTDLRRQFQLTGDSSNLPEAYQVYALVLQSSGQAGMLLLDTDDTVPGGRVFRLNLSNGILTREFVPPQMNWAALRQDGSVSVDLGAVRYSFRSGNVTTTVNSVVQDTRSISSVWGGRPFDAAIPIADQLFLFAGDSFSKLSQALATDDSGGKDMVANLRTALAVRTPIQGNFTNLPASLVDGFDAALPAGGDLFVFKGNQYVLLSGEAWPQPLASLKYNLVRLTTSTAAQLNRALFVGGVPALLSLRTQEVPETPGFSFANSGPTTILVNQDRVNEPLPPADHLDFGSANGVYLWEIFFHAPALIAGMLNTAQKFEDAKTWYECIFDPTEPADAWKFLPFLTEDVERIVLETRDRLDRLQQKGVNVDDLRKTLEPHLVQLLCLNPAFQGERDLTPDEQKELETVASLRDTLAAPENPGARLNSLVASLDASVQPLGEDLRELVDLAGELNDRWLEIKTNVTLPAQVQAYLDDPFDPHAIAALRPIAYRKATVMNYVSNLLDWGDMLFGQYTRESINEAFMLYILGWNVLGRRPESLGRRVLPQDSVYDNMHRPALGDTYDMLMELDSARKAQIDAQLSFAALLLEDPNQAPPQPYFFIAPNDALDQYWTRVADRLYKIRHGLNLQGVAQPLALFAPAINPMDLVNAVAGAGLAGLAAAAGADVPHYRFTFLVAKAKELAQTVAQLGSELLAALEKRDVEALYRLQATQEGIVLGMTLDMQKSQLAESQANLTSLQSAKDNAQKRHDTYQSWLDTGFLPAEEAQLGLLSGAVALNTLSALFNTYSVPLSLLPAITAGLFSFGATEEKYEKPAQGIAMALQAAAGAVQGLADILGITAQHQRSVQDWTLQLDLAGYDMTQIDAQIQGANCQIQAAQQQIQITQRQIGQNQAVSDFYHSKFTNQELYEWMISRLSDLHYQTYQLALDMARAAEQSLQFERGTQMPTSFIQGQSWDNQRKGLLSGYTLGLALDRMDAAFTTSDARRFQITKSISLIEIDPMAFLKLKAEQACEFDLGEALFDYDFPGHYCRQVKTIAIDLNLSDGTLVNATLTQLSNRVVMGPDPKAVSFLLAPKDTPPPSIRTDWKALQQVALSYHTQYETNSGVFDLIFEDDRFLPFEGTGAVSRWRLELGGPPGSYDLRNLTGVTITLKYTALQGGDAFAASVRGLLKPTDILRAFNLSTDFSDAWQAFLESDSGELDLPLTQDMFPNMVSGAIRAIYTRYEYTGQTPGSSSFVISIGQELPLPDGKTVDTSGLTIRTAGTTLILTVKGDKSTLANVYLVMGYKGGVR